LSVGQQLILIGEENRGCAPVGLGDYPDSCHPVFGEAVVIVSRQQPSALCERLVVGLPILIIQFSPVPFDVAIEGVLDEPGKVGDLAGQVVNTPRSDNLPGVENSIDYE